MKCHGGNQKDPVPSKEQNERRGTLSGSGLGARRALRAEHGIGEGSQQRASFISRRAHRHIAVGPRSF